MRHLPRSKLEPVVTFGLALAFALFGLTFRGPRARFWARMTRTGLALGGLALAAEPQLRRTRVRLRDVLVGLGSAGLLYGVFQIGDRLFRPGVAPGGGGGRGGHWAGH